jgi:hypothetical protein
MKQIKIFLIIVLLLSVFSVANPPPPQQPTFDYVNGDYSQITDWSQVDWSKIPPHRISEVPAEKISYQDLNSNQRMVMNVEQIKYNIEKIDNLLTDVDQQNMKDAIFLDTGVTLANIDTNAKNLKMEGGILKSDNGNFEFTPDKEDWEIEVDQDGVIKVINPQEIKESWISSNDQFTITEPINFVLNDGNLITVQDLSFDQGQAFVKEGKEALVGDYLIPAGDNFVEVYFDAKNVPQEGNFIFLSDDNIIVNSDSDGEVNLKPLPGNKLLNMVKRDYSTNPPTLIADDRDELDIKVSNGAGMEVISRADDDKTPLVQPLDDQGEILMENGRMKIRYQDGQIKVTPPKPFEGKTGPIDMRNSIAFELIIENNKKLITSSSNRFIQFDNNQKVFSNNMDLEVSNLIEPNMMKTVEDLRYKYPKVKFTFDGNSKSYYTEVTANMAQLTSQWLRDKPGVDKYIGIEFIMPQGMTSAGREGKISLSERDMNADYYLKNPNRETDSPLDTVDHEFVHVIDYLIESKDNIIFSDEFRKGFNQEEFKRWLKENKDIDMDKIPERTFEEDVSFGNQLSDYQQEYEEQKINKFKEELGMIDTIELNLGLELSQKFLTSQKFKDFVKDVNQLRLDEGIEKNILKNFNDIENPDLSQKGKVYNSMGIHNMHSYLDIQLKDKSNSPELKKKFQQFKDRYEKIIFDETGLYSYSFYPAKGAALSLNELPTTYGELPPEKARKHPKLAQLEYDKIMNLEDPPQWLKEKAEKRYYAIMGGKDSTYCQTNGCGPCKLYKLTCKAS